MKLKNNAVVVKAKDTNNGVVYCIGDRASGVKAYYQRLVISDSIRHDHPELFEKTKDLVLFSQLYCGWVYAEDPETLCYEVKDFEATYDCKPQLRDY